MKKHKKCSEIFVTGCLLQLMNRSKQHCNQLYDFDIKLFYAQESTSEHSSNMKAIEEVVINTINKEK